MEDKMAFSPTPYKHGLKMRDSDLSKTLLWIAISILSLPLFLLPRRGRPVQTKALHEMHPLAYLNGLRGYFAITICNGHSMAWTWKWIPDGIIAIPWLQFPFRCGHACLVMFFFISGYTVTYKAVGLMQTKRTGQLLDNLSSLAFRRYLRLMLPIIPVMFITTMLVAAEIAIMPPYIADDKPNANIKSHPFWYWITDVARILNPFTRIVGYSDGGTGSKLLQHTWSLPAEFRSSMILCVLCMATCKLSTRNRKILICLAIPAFVFWQAVWAAMAWIGMLFAECRHERQLQKQESQLLLLSKPSAHGRSAAPHIVDGDLAVKQGTVEFDSSGNRNNAGGRERFRKLALYAVFLYSFCVVTNPQTLEHNMTFPHNLINRITPSDWHIQSKMDMHLIVGSIMMLYPLDQMQELQRPLLTPFSQFLGELSFGIYAVHPTVKWVVWTPLYSPWINNRCGTRSMDYFWCAFPGYCGLIICVLWAAEAFRRLDMQVFLFCRWLESRLFEK